MELRIPQKVDTKYLVLGAIALILLYGVYDYGTKKGQENAIQIINDELPQVYQKLRDQGAQLYQQDLIKQCQASKEKQIVLTCPEPVRLSNDTKE